MAAIIRESSLFIPMPFFSSLGARVHSGAMRSADAREPGGLYIAAAGEPVSDRRPASSRFRCDDERGGAGEREERSAIYGLLHVGRLTRGCC